LLKEYFEAYGKIEKLNLDLIPEEKGGDYKSAVAYVLKVFLKNENFRTEWIKKKGKIYCSLFRFINYIILRFKSN